MCFESQPMAMELTFIYASEQWACGPERDIGRGCRNPLTSWFAGFSQKETLSLK